MKDLGISNGITADFGKKVTAASKIPDDLKGQIPRDTEIVIISPTTSEWGQLEKSDSLPNQEIVSQRKSDDSSFEEEEELQTPRHPIIAKELSPFCQSLQ